jgi:hypothetical protein
MFKCCIFQINVELTYDPAFGMYALVPRHRDKEPLQVSSQKIENVDARRFNKSSFHKVDDLSGDAVVRVKCEDPFSVASSHANSSHANSSPEDFLQNQDFPIQPVPGQSLSMKVF